MGNSTCPPDKSLPKDPVPLFSHGNINFKAHDVGWMVSVAFALLAFGASGWLINKHLSFYTNPNQQRYIVRILFMPPIYALVSFLSYFYVHEAIYYQIIRDCYEAVVIGSFFYLLLAYLSVPAPENSSPGALAGGSKFNTPALGSVIVYPAPEPPRKASRMERDAALRQTFRDFELKKWMWPLGSVKYRPASGYYFLMLMKWGILQYVVVRPLSTVAAVWTQFFGLYCLASWSPAFSHLWITTIVSISITIAMYNVLQIYVAMRRELAPYQPMLKFLSVKAVVFLTFWQDSFLGVLIWFGAIKDSQYWTATEIQVGIGCILECFEMAIFSFLHIKAFSYLPYRPILPDPKLRAEQKTNRLKALQHVLDFRDVFREIGRSSKHLGTAIQGGEVRERDRNDDLDVVMGQRGARKDAFAFRRERPGRVGLWRSPSETDLEKDLQRLREKDEDRYGYMYDAEDGVQHEHFPGDFGYTGGEMALYAAHHKLGYRGGGPGGGYAPPVAQHELSYKLFDPSMAQPKERTSKFLYYADGTRRERSEVEAAAEQEGEGGGLLNQLDKANSDDGWDGADEKEPVEQRHPPPIAKFGWPFRRPEPTPPQPRRSSEAWTSLPKVDPSPRAQAPQAPSPPRGPPAPQIGGLQLGAIPPLAADLESYLRTSTPSMPEPGRRPMSMPPAPQQATAPPLAPARPLPSRQSTAPAGPAPPLPGMGLPRGGYPGPEAPRRVSAGTGQRGVQLRMPDPLSPSRFPAWATPGSSSGHTTGDANTPLASRSGHGHGGPSPIRSPPSAHAPPGHGWPGLAIQPMPPAAAPQAPREAAQGPPQRSRRYTLESSTPSQLGASPGGVGLRRAPLAWPPQYATPTERVRTEFSPPRQVPAPAQQPMPGQRRERPFSQPPAPGPDPWRRDEPGWVIQTYEAQRRQPPQGGRQPYGYSPRHSYPVPPRPNPGYGYGYGAPPPQPQPARGPYIEYRSPSPGPARRTLQPAPPQSPPARDGW